MLLAYLALVNCTQYMPRKGLVRFFFLNIREKGSKSW